MSPLRSILFVALLFVVCDVVAQSDLDDESLMAIDESLFLMGGSLVDDPYAEATKYYTTPVDVRRRGLDWWVQRDINSRFLPVREEYEEPQSRSRVRVVGSSKRYQYGALVELARGYQSGWSFDMEVDYRAGRDMCVEGVFSSDLRPKFLIGKLFGEDHNIKISIDMPLLMHSLQGSATAESFELTGNNLYNPSWGLYDGKERSSRVSKSRVGELSVQYERPVSESTSLYLDAVGECGRRMFSSLGWYDAYNPTPDYYRNMPSYLPSGDLRRDVETLWRSDDEMYIQIAWDRLVEMNQRSSSGDAYYIVEDRVTRECNVDMKLMFESRFGEALSLRYGVRGEVVADRCFKEVDDLLGAQYHLDIDQYIGDYANLGNDMQNDLRHPNREVMEGDRFGYDYIRHSRELGAMLGFEYRERDLSVRVDATLGGARSWRDGHYEKERFVGDSSYGCSSIVLNSVSSVDFVCRYAVGERHRLSLRGAMCRMPQDHADMFIEEQSANMLNRHTEDQRFGLLSVGYALRTSDLSLDVEGYYQRLANRTDVWSGYDDLSYTYTDIVMSGISTRSVGVEACGSYRVSRRFNLDFALSLGDYTYDRAPHVELYDNSDMDLISEAVSVASEGCKVGNAPQFVASGGVDFSVAYGLSISMDCSYAAGRYVAPSFVRRSERVLRGASSQELADDIIEQRSLGSAFDMSLSVLRSFDLRGGDRMSLYLRVDNLLGDRGRVDYGRESSRILRGADYSTTGSYYLQADEFIYTSPRTFYISCSYVW